MLVLELIKQYKKVKYHKLAILRENNGFETYEIFKDFPMDMLIHMCRTYSKSDKSELHQAAKREYYNRKYFKSYVKDFEIDYLYELQFFWRYFIGSIFKHYLLRHF